jgi:hypothetical protein
MGCCGRARANLSHSRVSRVGTTSSTPDASAVSSQHALIATAVRNAGQSVTLRYQGGAGIVVRGPATGASYAFSSSEPLRSVNAKDAAVLLRTGSFRLLQGS